MSWLGRRTRVTSWHSSSAARFSLQSFDHLNIIFIGPCAMCKPYEMISRAIQIVPRRRRLMSSCHGHVGKAGWVVVGKAGNRSAGRLLARGVPFLRDCAPTRGVSVQSPGSAVTFLAGFCCCCCCRCRSLLSSVLGGSEAAFAGLLEALLLLFRLRLQFLLLHFRRPLLRRRRRCVGHLLFVGCRS